MSQAAHTVHSEGWESMPFVLDGGSPAKAAIGLITLDDDLSVEPEVSTFLPTDGVGLYANRIPCPRSGTMLESLRAMEGRIRDTTALINPGEKLDVVIFGCTSGTMAIGDEIVHRKIKEARPDVLATDPITAGIAGLRRLGCRKVAVLTPYIDEVNAVVEHYIQSKGMAIGAAGSFKCRGSGEICRVAPESVYEAGLALGRKDVDGLFISCTALRVSPIIGALETDLGKPVVSSNQALAWHATRLAGCEQPVEGYGQLLMT